VATSVPGRRTAFRMSVAAERPADGAVEIASSSQENDGSSQALAKGRVTCRLTSHRLSESSPSSVVIALIRPSHRLTRCGIPRWRPRRCSRRCGVYGPSSSPRFPKRSAGHTFLSPGTRRHRDLVGVRTTPRPARSVACAGRVVGGSGGRLHGSATRRIPAMLSAR
jgi:hypothetical protein